MKLSRLAPVVALAALVGCSPSPSTAATVAGTEIPVSAVSAAVAGCAEIGANVREADAVRWLVIREAVVATAAERDIVLDDEQIARAAKSDPTNGVLATNADCAQIAEGPAALNLLALQMDPQAIVAALTEVDVEVNPRFGTWQPADVNLGGSGSMSVPAGPTS